MLQFKVLILELGAVDRLPSSAIASSEVAALDHELLDDPVETRAFVVQRLARLADTLLASAQGTEVLGRLGHYIVVQLECDTPSRFVADGDIEEDAAASLLDLVGAHVELGRMLDCGGLRMVLRNLVR